MYVLFHRFRVLTKQASLERDKIKADLELADRRNLQLVREIDDRHATMESLNESKIKYVFRIWNHLELKHTIFVIQMFVS